MAKKTTAHRPSQSDQEYVIMSDGRKVRNTAYIPSAKKNTTGNATAHAVSQELASQTLADYDSHVQTAETGLDGMINVIDSIKKEESLNTDDALSIMDLPKSLHAVRETNQDDFYALMDEYGFDNISVGYEVRDTFARGDVEKYSIKINSDDKNMPTSIKTEIEQPNKFHPNNAMKITTVFFDGNNDTDVKHMTVSENSNGVNILRQRKNGKTISDIIDNNGDVMHFENSMVTKHTIQPGNNTEIKLKLLQEEADGFDVVDIENTVHDDGLAQNSPVEYTYNSDASKVIASWNEDGVEMRRDYELEGNKSINSRTYEVDMSDYDPEDDDDDSYDNDDHYEFG